jgi:hypothetical protein
LPEMRGETKSVITGVRRQACHPKAQDHKVQSARSSEAGRQEAAARSLPWRQATIQSNSVYLLHASLMGVEYRLPRRFNVRSFAGAYIGPILARFSEIMVIINCCMIRVKLKIT